METLEALNLTPEQAQAVEAALAQLRDRAERAEREAGALRDQLGGRDRPGTGPAAGTPGGRPRFAAPIGAGGPPQTGSGRAARLAEEFGRALYGR